MDDKTKKKQTLSVIIKEIERILHNAVDLGMDKNLTPFEMLLIATKSLHEQREKKPSPLSLAQPSSSETGKVIPFKKKQ
jgi:hypothetical protein